MSGMMYFFAIAVVACMTWLAVELWGPEPHYSEWYYRGPAMCQDVSLGGYGPRPHCVEIQVRPR